MVQCHGAKDNVKGIIGKLNKNMNVNKKYKTGICWGSWDGLHVGHLNLLRKASKYCDILYVGVSTDDYIRKVKGHDPMFSYKSRVMSLKIFAKQFITKVFPQNLGCYSKKNIIKKINLDIIFVGSDWKNKEWEGSNLGIKIKYIPYTKEISSTMLRLKKIK